jgi:hypothetical protein
MNDAGIPYKDSADRNVVSRLGLEPRALALKGRCSTN